jgi:tetratricopeptide (TPR) repeat protein
MSALKATSFDSRLNRLLARGKWAEARKLLAPELARDPDDHWLLARMSAVYYEQRKYHKAFELIEKAHQAAPNCPLVLWDMAGTLDMLGKKEQAIQIYLRLIERGVESIAHDECGEGIRWARSLVTDYYYRLAQCYLDRGQKTRAVNCMRTYLERRALGAQSIYSRKEAKKQLAQLTTYSSEMHALADLMGNS